jgi:hypothetical protein
LFLSSKARQAQMTQDELSVFFETLDGLGIPSIGRVRLGLLRSIFPEHDYRTIPMLPHADNLLQYAKMRDLIGKVEPEFIHPYLESGMTQKAMKDTLKMLCRMATAEGVRFGTEYVPGLAGIKSGKISPKAIERLIQAIMTGGDND